MSNIITSYLVYLPVSIWLTIWTGRTLFNHGQIFLNDTFHGNEALSHAVNRLLLTGFYLINAGYCVYTLKIMGEIETTRELFEVLSLKLGRIILILGGMHFFNLFIFFRLRKKALREKTHPADATAKS